MSLLGTVYLLHFDTPFKHARHYTGTTASSVLLGPESRQSTASSLPDGIADGHRERRWPRSRRAFLRCRSSFPADANRSGSG